MSARPGITVDATVPSDGGEQPNRFQPLVSVHVRAYWPPLATEAEIEEALTTAFALARESVDAKRASS